MHLLTIDLEEWFHINDSSLYESTVWPVLDSRIMEGTTSILEFLENYNIKATFFIVGWIAYMYPGLVMKISEAGHHIGYHSWRHKRPFRQSTSEYIDDLQEGIQLIELLTNRKVEAYRAPNFSLERNTEWVYRCLIDNGISCSSSIMQGARIGDAKVPGYPFIIRSTRGQLVEFPLNQCCGTTFSGSGYFRLCPPSILNLLYKNHEYTVSYFHPRDFDTELNLPIELGYLRNWMHCVGNTTTRPKIESLAESRKFVSIHEAMKHINIETLEVIEI